MTAITNMDGIQPPGWQSALPRPEYQAYERIFTPADSDWYEVYLVLPGVYAIYEPGHFQEVISYLIMGKGWAILWDTGMGVAPIRPLAESLTDLPIIVVNSHNHFDHTGGNAEFPHVYCHMANQIEARASSGYAHDFLAPMMTADSLAKPLPADFDLASYRVRPWKALDAGDLFSDGAFNLGGRQVELLPTPGHSADSVMLFDRQTGVLFTGDTLYPAALYAHFDSAEYGKSSLGDYAETMDALLELTPYLTNLCCSHNVPLNPPSLLTDAAAAFRRIQSGQSRGVPEGNGLSRHIFRGFSIIVKQRRN